jgi:hypothetical protein
VPFDQPKAERIVGGLRVESIVGGPPIERIVDGLRVERIVGGPPIERIVMDCVSSASSMDCCRDEAQLVAHSCHSSS